MAKRTIVDVQKLRDKKCKDASNSETHSPYWDDVEKHGRSANHEDWKEHPQANPDCFVENDTAPSTPQLLMGEAIQHLQGRQREVYFLTMREDKSLSEVAEILGIAKGAADTYKRRAIKFLTQYCRAAIAKGRV